MNFERRATSVTRLFSLHDHYNQPKQNRLVSLPDSGRGLSVRIWGGLSILVHMIAHFEPALARHTPLFAHALMASTLLFLTQVASAADSASQRFRMHVPVTSNVAVPTERVVVDQVNETTGEFPEQSWSLESNSAAGLVADFTVASAFVHQDNPTIQHDARLRIRVSEHTGSGQWVATQGEDQTRQSNGDQSAGVQVQSNAPGSAKVALSVSLVDDFALMAPGTYSTTVVCTIASP